MRLMHLCVFCGSSSGRHPQYAAAAAELGATLAHRGIALVYGGSRIGLMGALADAALAHGGRVIGVMPQNLMRREVAHHGLSELQIVETMHARKQRMAELADGFVALPGGMGTLEELTEILTWAQLGLHAKPVGLLNVADYFSPWLAFLDHAVEQRFLKPAHRRLLFTETRIDALLQRLAQIEPGFERRRMP